MLLLLVISQSAVEGQAKMQLQIIKASIEEFLAPFAHSSEEAVERIVSDPRMRDLLRMKEEIQRELENSEVLSSSWHRLEELKQQVQKSSPPSSSTISLRQFNPLYRLNTCWTIQRLLTAI